MTSINEAFRGYVEGEISGWELLEVVQDNGFVSFHVTEQLELVLIP